MFEIVELILGIELIIINKVMSFFFCDTVNMRDFVSELDSIELVGMLQQLRSEIEKLIVINKLSKTNQKIEAWFTGPNKFQR